MNIAVPVTTVFTHRSTVSVSVAAGLARCFDMIPVEAHLLLNHVPLVGLVFGLAFVVAGLMRGTDQTLRAGLGIFFVVMGIAVVPVVEAAVAANLLMNAAWLDANAVSRHQLAGIVTSVVLVGLGALSGIALLVSRRTGRLSGRLTVAIVVLALAGLGATGWTLSRWRFRPPWRQRPPTQPASAGVSAKMCTRPLAPAAWRPARLPRSDVDDRQLSTRFRRGDGRRQCTPADGPERTAHAVLM